MPNPRPSTGKLAWSGVRAEQIPPMVLLCRHGPIPADCARSASEIRSATRNSSTGLCAILLLRIDTFRCHVLTAVVAALEICGQEETRDSCRRPWPNVHVSSVRPSPMAFHPAFVVTTYIHETRTRSLWQPSVRRRAPWRSDPAQHTARGQSVAMSE
jgi:diadenosine tetraphosphatase ApaH/serine/threonine PP2A family protein phosphatase